MLRDKTDYDTNNVYFWKRRHHWSSASQSVSGFKKHEAEILDDTLVVSDLDESPARIAISGPEVRATPLAPAKKQIQRRKHHERGQNRNTGGHAGVQKEGMPRSRNDIHPVSNHASYKLIFQCIEFV